MFNIYVKICLTCSIFQIFYKCIKIIFENFTTTYTLLKQILYFYFNIYTHRTENIENILIIYEMVEQ